MANARPVRNLRGATKPQHHHGYMRLTALLRETRIVGGWTQRDIAERLKKPPSYVHKTETGSRRLDLRETVEYCAALKLDLMEAIKAVSR